MVLSVAEYYQQMLKVGGRRRVGRSREAASPSLANGLLHHSVSQPVSLSVRESAKKADNLKRWVSL